jgi:hypothetical protein
MLPGTDSKQARRRPHVSLVLMDSRLDGLNLPVLKPHIQGPSVAELEGPKDLPYRVALLMDHYFDSNLRTVHWQKAGFEGGLASTASAKRINSLETVAVGAV